MAGLGRGRGRGSAHPQWGLARCRTRQEALASEKPALQASFARLARPTCWACAVPEPKQRLRAAPCIAPSAQAHEEVRQERPARVLARARPPRGGVASPRALPGERWGCGSSRATGPGLASAQAAVSVSVRARLPPLCLLEGGWAGRRAASSAAPAAPLPCLLLPCCRLGLWRRLPGLCRPGGGGRLRRRRCAAGAARLPPPLPVALDGSPRSAAAADAPHPPHPCPHASVLQWAWAGV